MINSKIKLVDYEEIESNLILEREGYLKLDIHDDESIRSIEDAKKILDCLQLIHKSLYDFILEYPSLNQLFNKEFINIKEFLCFENSLDTCFIGHYIFSHELSIPIVDENLALNPDGLSKNIVFINDWISEKITNHNENIILIRKNENFEFLENEMKCSCTGCLSEYRSRLWDIVLDRRIELINKCSEEILNCITSDIKSINKIFNSLKKELDINLARIRKRFKRSSISKIETQSKNHLKNKFGYPSDLVMKYTPHLISFFKEVLKKENLNRELVNEAEYERFFIQLSVNIWRDQGYLEREFRKFLQSLLLIKRKDISSEIIKQHLGEFWVYSKARRLKRKIIYHMGPTNSGKTYQAIQALCKAGSGCYLAPLRLLASELYDTMNANGVSTTLLTGEEVIEVKNSTHFSSTIEMAKLGYEFECCVIDEIQMLSDPQRGWAWTRALVNINATEVHICGDHSVLDLVNKIVDLCGDELEIKTYERMTKLDVEKNPVSLNQLKRSDAVIVFSRRKALEYKRYLEQNNFKVSIIYGRLNPEVRREQARKFDVGETDVLVSTDAIAMGMNLPIRRIIFSTFSKYIDHQEVEISKSEIKQISGRCGRYKRFPVGYVTCLEQSKNGANKIIEALKVSLPQKEKCMVGPDLEIFSRVNNILGQNSLPLLKLSEFLRLFNTMQFKDPFYCVDLKEMIELAEMVEEANSKKTLNDAEIFGFACSPVNLGLLDHVQYFVWIVSRFANQLDIPVMPIESKTDDIEYLEISIKCVELYQWLARHFDNKFFEFDEDDIHKNKGDAVSRLNDLLSEKSVLKCSNCKEVLPDFFKFAICENCFKNRNYKRKRIDNKVNSKMDKRKKYKPRFKTKKR